METHVALGVTPGVTADNARYPCGVDAAFIRGFGHGESVVHASPP